MDRRPAYLTICPIAQGGMGVVELAVRREGRFRRLCAIKRPLPERRDDPAYREMLMEEARIAGLVRHPNVVGVVDAGQDARGPFLVMEYVEGLSVGALITGAEPKDQLLPVRLCVAIALGAARGLHAAHELRGQDGAPLGLVHRDVSPQNILVGFDGVVRVTDFGIAKTVEDVGKTSTGLVKGKVGYLSPEQLRFEEPDRRSDLFSLGVVLYELLARAPLYPNEDGNRSAQRILNEPPPDIGEVRDDVPPELTALLFELLAKDPAVRPADARAVALRLEAVLNGDAADEGPFDLGAYMVDSFGAVRDAEAARVQAALARLPDEARGKRWSTARVALIVVAVATLGGAALLALRPGSAPLAPSLFAGHWHTCAIGRQRRLSCWGKNNEAQLGESTTSDRNVPAAVRGLRGAVQAATGGRAHTCALLSTGQVHCWGRNVEGQLGFDGPALVKAPTPVPAIAPVRQLDAGGHHTCAVLLGGKVVCWGQNSAGQLPGVDQPRRSAPTEVPGIDDAVEVESKDVFTCVRRKTGTVACWGDLEEGWTRPFPRGARVPQAVPGLTDASDLAVGADFACAVRVGGQVVCWGENRVGQLGDGTREGRATPAPVRGVEKARAIAAGAAHACAADADGALACWGLNEWGNMGDGTHGRAMARPMPGRTTGLSAVVDVAAGRQHTCARQRDGVLVCWGLNETGQLGDASRENRHQPVSVIGAP